MRSRQRRLTRFLPIPALICGVALFGGAPLAVAGVPTSTSGTPVPTSVATATSPIASTPATESAASAASATSAPGALATPDATYPCEYIANGSPSPPWGVWVRTGAGTGYPTFGPAIPNGTDFYATCGTVNGFVRLPYQGQLGWANRTYLIEILS